MEMKRDLQKRCIEMKRDLQKRCIEMKRDLLLFDEPSMEKEICLEDVWK